MNSASKGTYKAGQQVTVEVETPVKISGSTPITLMADTVMLQQLTYPEQVSLDKTGTEVSFKLPELNNRLKQVSIVLDSTALVPLQGAPLSFQPVSIAIAEARGTGTISGSITTNQKSYTVQLLTSEYKVVEEKKNGQKNLFRNVEPGKYLIRVLVDENNNGKWDKGDPEMKRAPEKVYLYPETIDVRANWEREDINLKF